MAQNKIKVYTRKISGIFTWEGELYGPKGRNIPRIVSRNTLDSLAQNLALNISNHPSPEHNTAELSDYAIVNQAGEHASGSDKPKALIPAREREFNEALVRYFRAIQAYKS